MLDRLGELEANEVLVEAGATLAGEWLRSQLVDELLLYVAPKLLGRDAPRTGGGAARSRSLRMRSPSRSWSRSRWARTCGCACGRGGHAPLERAAVFTGIIQDVGRIESREARGGDVRLVVGFREPRRRRVCRSATASACRGAA